MSYVKSTTFFSSFYILTTPQPPRSPLFPYTTLFRSPEHLFRLAREELHQVERRHKLHRQSLGRGLARLARDELGDLVHLLDRKSTRLNSSHMSISYAVFCLKKKKRSSQRRSERLKW